MAAKPENAPPPPPSAAGEGGRSSRGDAKDDDEYGWIEKRYWQGFLHKPAVYGSDNHSHTLFEECAGEWNLSALPTMLRERIRYKMPGINSPYLYMGMWRACFCWHVEDMDLYSINFLHWGEPKLWYAVDASHSQRMESMACALHPTLALECKQFLRHKGTMISPSHVVNAGIPVTRVVQQPGEFVITMPYAYHSGFNLGLNCAEAVNFASDRWLPYGRNAKLCNCFPDTVRIKMEIFDGDGKGVGGGDAVCLEETIDDIVCERCKEGKDDDVIVLCDECTGGYHLPCCRPPLKQVPRGRWICDVCAKNGGGREDSRESGGVGVRGKCCACGIGCEDVRLMEELQEISDAWHSNETLGVFPKNRFLVCEGCADFRGEADWKVSEEDGMCGICLWCASNNASMVQMHQHKHCQISQGPDMLCCAKCHRAVCEACINRNYPKGALQKAKDDDGWLCSACNVAALATKKEKAAGMAALAAARKALQGWEDTVADTLIRNLRTGGGGGWSGVVDGSGKEEAVVKSAVAKLKKIKGGALWGELGLAKDSWGEGGGRAVVCHFCGGKGGEGAMFACGAGTCRMRFCASCIERHFPSSWDFLIDAAAKVARPVETGQGGGWPYDRQVWGDGSQGTVAVRESGEVVAGDLLECEDMGGFYAARVLEVQQRASGREGIYVKVHFTGWKIRFDHWVPLCSPRLCDRSKNSKELEVEKYAKGGQMVRKVPDEVRREIKVFSKKRKGSVVADDGSGKKRKAETKEGGSGVKKRGLAPPKPEPRKGPRSSTRVRGGRAGGGGGLWTSLPSVVSWTVCLKSAGGDVAEGGGVVGEAKETKEKAGIEVEREKACHADDSKGQEQESKSGVAGAESTSTMVQGMGMDSHKDGTDEGGKGAAEVKVVVEEDKKESSKSKCEEEVNSIEPRTQAANEQPGAAEAVSLPAAAQATQAKGARRGFVEYLSTWSCPVCALDCPCAMKDPSGVDPCLRLKQRLGRKRKSRGDAKGEEQEGKEQAGEVKKDEEEEEAKDDKEKEKEVKDDKEKEEVKEGEAEQGTIKGSKGTAVGGTPKEVQGEARGGGGGMEVDAAEMDKQAAPLGTGQ